MSAVCSITDEVGLLRLDLEAMRAAAIEKDAPGAGSNGRPARTSSARGCASKARGASSPTATSCIARTRPSAGARSGSRRPRSASGSAPGSMRNSRSGRRASPSSRCGRLGRWRDGRSPSSRPLRPQRRGSITRGRELRPDARPRFTIHLEGETARTILAEVADVSHEGLEQAGCCSRGSSANA